MLQINAAPMVTCLLLLLMHGTPALADQPDVAWQFTDLDETVHRPFDDEHVRGIVLVFISTDCPIANGYQPLLQRLGKTYGAHGIRFFLIHPGSDVTVSQAQAHAREFGIEIPVVIDTKQVISRRAGATVTPEAFVYVRNQANPVYQGRIDNLYAGYGKKRTVATTNDLADALDAVVAGHVVTKSKTKAVGCFISYAD